MTLCKIHTKRDINIISLSSEENIHKILDIDINEISKIVLSFEQNKRLTHMDFGSWCYSSIKTTRNNIGCLVDLNSFKFERMIGVKFLLEEILNTRKSNKTILYFYKEVNPIFKYLNENYYDCNCSILSNAEHIYTDYSKKLINDIELKKSEIGTINTEHHRFKQEILAKFLAACTKANINHFYGLARKIEGTRAIKPINKDQISQDINKKVKVLLDLFNIIADYLLNNQDLPYVIDLKHHGLNKIYIDLNFINKSQEFFLNLFYEDNKIVPIDRFNKNMDEFYKNFEHYDGALQKRMQRKRYYEKLKGVEKLNSLQFKECRPKIVLANFCMVAFAKLLISTSGANESVLYNLTIDGFKTISSEKGKRSFGVKNRAGGKVVTLEFGLKFQVIFNKYIDLRKKINSHYNEMTEDLKNLLFIKLPVMNNFSSFKNIIMLDSHSFDHFNKIFKLLFGDTTATNKELRENVANSYFNSTNSSIITSQKLSNTPQIASKVYSNTSFTEIAEQFSNYFKKIDDVIIFKGRKHHNLIPVKTLSNDDVSTIVGNCSNHKPKLIEGFNDEAPQPICGTPQSCFYCDSYVIHLNKKDIKKILSFKFILEYKSQIKDEQQRLIYRIDEILRFISKQDSSIEQLTNEVWNEVNEGYLDEYWDNHLNLLIDMEMLV
ncbi:hypothetical protein ACJOWW_03795 [Acinetobacter baumannii]